MDINGLLFFYSGGVLTPGVAFRDTKLISKLNANGVAFQVKEPVKEV